MRYGAGVATLEACREALARFHATVAGNRAELRRKLNLDRRMVCRITDLGVSFRGRFVDGELRDLTEGDDPAAQITLSASSDDLIALIDGRLDAARALATRRVSLRASPLDLLRLRKLL